MPLIIIIIIIINIKVNNNVTIQKALISDTSSNQKKINMHSTETSCPRGLKIHVTMSHNHNSVRKENIRQASVISPQLYSSKRLQLPYVKPG